MLWGQGEGEVTGAGVVGGAGRGGEAEPGAAVDDRAGGSLAPGALADAGLPAGADRVLKALCEVGAGPTDLWSLTYRSTVRWETPSASAAARVPLSCLTTLLRNSPVP
ncbi:hypothetical protein DIZ27_43275 [Streptomyces sp. NWU339]|nr:hypothetical protein DIZ27_43275 [Streptomyces sp. NWU339]